MSSDEGDDTWLRHNPGKRKPYSIELWEGEGGPDPAKAPLGPAPPEGSRRTVRFNRQTQMNLAAGNPAGGAAADNQLAATVEGTKAQVLPLIRALKCTEHHAHVADAVCCIRWQVLHLQAELKNTRRELSDAELRHGTQARKLTQAAAEAERRANVAELRLADSERREKDSSARERGALGMLRAAERDAQVRPFN
jgi:hypothetical protein